MPDDLLAAAIAELYGGDPEAFTDRRKTLAAAARGAGDRAAAAAIGALRKPTRAAWVVNRLARDDPGASSRLAGLAAELRAAQRAADGRRLRELSAARGALLDALTAQALADPEVAASFAAGTLTRAMQWSGFGMQPADADADSGAGAERATTITSSRPGATAARERSPHAGAPSKAGETGKAGAPSKTGAAAKKDGAEERSGDDVRRQAETAERAARETAAREARQAREAAEAAERAARRREQYEDAERAVDSAAAAAAEAVLAEDRLEAGVRDLEERLGRARSELEAARLRARRAEAAERRARQARDRLPR